MKAMDQIRWAMQLTEGGTMRMVEDLRSAPLTQPTPGAQNGGNHALWTLGHLCWIEGNVRYILLGEPNPVTHWKALFAAGQHLPRAARVQPEPARANGRSRARSRAEERPAGL